MALKTRAAPLLVALFIAAISLPLASNLAAECDAAVRVARGLWTKDASSWSGDPGVQKTIANRLGWLESPALMAASVDRITTFAEGVRRRLALPVHLWDERLSSAQANRLLRETDMSIKRRGAVVDQMAAVLILQNFLDMRTGGAISVSR